jgi:hypothetical protein
LSNKRRKTIGATKIKRNRLIRIARGARRLGAPWPGDSILYKRDVFDARGTVDGELLRKDMLDLVAPYWRGSSE